MTGMDVEVVEARQRQIPPVTAATLDLWQAQAEMLAASDMVPSGYRGRPANIVAAAMIGSELGWSLTTSLVNIHTWETSRNVSSWNPATKRKEWTTVTEPVTAIAGPAKLALLTLAGHSYAVVEHTAEVCSVVGERCDRPCRCPEPCPRHYPVTVSIRDPDLAHLAGRGTEGDSDFIRPRPSWVQHPRRMLWWRTVSELVAVMCPEVVIGLTADIADRDSVGDTPPVSVAAPIPETVRMGRTPDTPALPAGLPDAHPASEMSMKARRKQEVLDALGGDRDLAVECWAAIEARGSWLLTRDPAAFAAEWQRNRLAAQGAASSSDPGPGTGRTGQGSEDPVLCGHASRDGRTCLRAPHSAGNHRYQPPSAGGEPTNPAGAPEATDPVPEDACDSSDVVADTLEPGPDAPVAPGAGPGPEPEPGMWPPGEEPW